MTQTAAPPDAPPHSLSIDIPGSEFMTEKETAALMRCSLRSLANLRARGELPHFRIGRRVIYLRRDVLRLLARAYVTKGASDAA
jgi:hypothetical protein